MNSQSLDDAAPAEENPDSLAQSELSDPHALRAEVAKWQERVPKLAAALRKKTDALAVARDEIRQLRAELGGADPQGAGDDPRLMHRDRLIASLEERLASATSRYQEQAGDLQAAKMACEDALSDLKDWKQKWQELSQTLDSEFAERQALQRQCDAQDTHTRDFRAKIAELEASLEAQEDAMRRKFSAENDALRRESEEEINSLRRRNGQLAETTELANQQIMSLGDDLERLSAELAREKKISEELQKARDELQEELEQRTAELDEQRSASQLQKDSASERMATLEAECQTLNNTIQALERELEETQGKVLRSQDASSVEREERNRDIATLQACVEDLENQLADHAAAMNAEREQASQREDSLVRQQLALEEEHAQRLSEQSEQLDDLRQQIDAQQEELNQQSSRDDDAKQTVAELREENAKLRQHLEERSTLVRELEAERHQHNFTRHPAAESQPQQLETLEKELASARRKIATFTEHTELLEARLEERRNLLSNAKEDLDSEQRKVVSHKKSLESQRQELFTLRREQEAALSRLRAQHLEDCADLMVEVDQGMRAIACQRWDLLELENACQALQQGQHGREAVDDEAMPSDVDLAAEPITELRQELKQAQREIERLNRELGNDTEEVFDPNDLTQLRGVGLKLAEQLQALGVEHLEQIASLDIAELDDESHLLSGFRTRIMRDCWIEQAQQLLSVVSVERS